MHTLVWKYPIVLGDGVTSHLMLPVGCKAVHVEEDTYRLPQIWVQFDKLEELSVPVMEPRVALVVGTGTPFDSTNFHHVGTIQKDGYVWHIYLNRDK